mgnify:CR=1 FL=1
MSRLRDNQDSRSRADLLVEIGTEELPPQTLIRLGQTFGTALAAELANQGLVENPKINWFATPRRLAARITGVKRQQPDQISERRGPALAKAFNDQGEPTSAASGFARSLGVGVEALERLETEKGAWLVHRSSQHGQSAKALVPGCIENAVNALPVAKRMRWGDSDVEFVRPVHWLVVLHGKQTIHCRLLNVSSGNLSAGHRFMAKQPVKITCASSYEIDLKSAGQVIADFSVRRRMISRQIARLANRAGGVPVVDPGLLDLVTGLVEKPHSLLGSFDVSFVKMPTEVLVSSMRDHQKYFHLVDEQGTLLPCFIAVSNIRSKQPARVRQGNERVLKARLSDARFFWDEDRRRTLESRVTSLKSVTFHHRLGSLYDKTLRLEILAGQLARHLGQDPSLSSRAARLSKADLVSDMVGEFPNLQGTMGRHYADHDGEKRAVSRAIEEHYLPRQAGDSLPGSGLGRIVSLTDRVDSLVGLFSAGEEPSGDRDPYALRRAALGIIRILIEKRIDLDITTLIDMSVDAYQQTDCPIEQEAPMRVSDFLVERYRALYLAAGFRNDEITAVTQTGATHPLDFDRRLKAVARFRRLRAAASLAGANKRIRNILRRVDQDVPLQFNDSLFEHQAERDLAAALVRISTAVWPLIERSDYTRALKQLAGLGEPVDRFFDDVMVMAENPDQRSNRLALLNQLASLFLAIADISHLQPTD